MKGMILLLLVLAIPLAVSAQSWIGIFDNAEGVAICHADIQLGVPQALYLMAVLAPAEFPDGITAAEFRVDNLPPNDCAEGGIITENWSSEVVVGDLDWDFSIAWPTPQLGPWVLIGELEFLMLDSAWIGDDHVMEIMAGNTCECLVLVDDQFVARDVIGGEFTWNCTGECLCIWVTAAEESSWTEVESLY